MHAQPREDFYTKMDAANVDLKAFTDDFYVKQTGSHLQPVLDTLKYLRQETKVWLEITTLLIPGYNDSAHEIGKMSEWLARALGTDFPLHFTSFHPDYKMTAIPATPAAKLTEARQIAHSAGLLHVYTGNVHDLSGGTTHCANCHAPLIVRDWYQIRDYAVTENGECSHCGAKLAGHFGKFEGQFGRRRIPVMISTP
jgi:pyruvate formate lyase activating enzyme